MTYVGIVGIINLYVPENQTVNTVLSVTGDSSILSVLGARVMLNLKIEGERSLQQGTNQPEKSTLLGIEFSPPSLDDVDRPLDAPAEDKYQSGTAETGGIAV